MDTLTGPSHNPTRVRAPTKNKEDNDPKKKSVVVPCFWCSREPKEDFEQTHHPSTFPTQQYPGSRDEELVK